MRCIARCKSNPFKQCSFKISSSCNKLCNKHINEENVETIEKNLFNEKINCIQGNDRDFRPADNRHGINGRDGKKRLGRYGGIH